MHALHLLITSMTCYSFEEKDLDWARHSPQGSAVRGGTTKQSFPGKREMASHTSPGGRRQGKLLVMTSGYSESKTLS